MIHESQSSNIGENKILSVINENGELGIFL